MFIKLRAVVAGSALLAASAGVAMAYPATVTTALNLRTGPGGGYAVETTIPAGAGVNVHSCGGGWCHLGFRGLQGYASAAYIAGAGPAIGAAVVGAAVLPEYYAYAYEYPPYWRNGYFYYWYGGHWRHVRRDRRWWHAHRSFIRSHRYARHEHRMVQRQHRRIAHQRNVIRQERRSAHHANRAAQRARHAARRAQAVHHRAVRQQVHRHAAVRRQAAHRAARHAAAHRSAVRHAARGGGGRARAGGGHRQRR
ncbi:MAG TPA: SH3 domain-containing protein [Hyphomicrobiales bacterium]|nr:SH3 domain-containing protein [Hyphomicrobiales bacterium]